MASTNASSRTFLHPASGALILGLDWLFFAEGVLTLGLSTPFLALLGFGMAGLGTGLVQRRYGGHGTGAAALKGMLGGVAVGIPLPIAGTAVGGGILALSGLNNLWGRVAAGDDDSSSPSDTQ